MNILPVKTRVLTPPKDDLFAVIEAAALDLKDGDVVVITSKVAAIHQGRCIKKRDVIDKEELVRQESDAYLPAEQDERWNLSVKRHALLLSAGIDESNADGYYVLLPDKPDEFAREVHAYLCDENDVNNLGIIVTDSHSIPFRYGTLGVAIGFHGIEPVRHFSGERDLFGREFNYTRINVVDALAGAAVFMMGETTEQTPLCVIRDAPHVEFTNDDVTDELYIPPKEDIYYPLLKPLYEDKGNDTDLDTLRVIGHEIITHIGTTKDERSAPQSVLVDLEITTDMKEAIATDDLKNCIDYLPLMEKIDEHFHANQYQLIEAAAHKVAEIVLHHPRAVSIDVTLKKPSPTDNVEHVAVSLSRS